VSTPNAESDWPSDLVVHTAAALRHSHKDCGCPLSGISTEDVIEVLDEWKRQESSPDPLAALRAEVVRLRDEMHGAAMKAADVREIKVRSVGVHCYTRVLDLIDKREGQ